MLINIVAASTVAIAEAAAGGVLYEKVFLEISQNSQENTWVRVWATASTIGIFVPYFFVICVNNF